MRSARSMRSVVVNKVSKREIVMGMIADDLQRMSTNLRTTLCVVQTNAPELKSEFEALQEQLSALRSKLTSATNDDARGSPFPGVHSRVNHAEQL